MMGRPASPALSGAQSDIGRDLTWMRFGLCRGVDPDVFFPTDIHGVIEARRICDQCPARAACLDYAVENRLEHGIWGGTSERERKKIIARRRWGVA